MYNETNPLEGIMNTTSKNQKASRLTNFMEELAGNILDDLLTKEKKLNFSEDAIEDIKALALNRLWPMYTTTTAGKSYLQKIVEADKVEKDVIRELRAAMDIVRSNPRD